MYSDPERSTPSKRMVVPALFSRWLPRTATYGTETPTGLGTTPECTATVPAELAPAAAGTTVRARSVTTTPAERSTRRLVGMPEVAEVLSRICNLPGIARWDVAPPDNRSYGGHY
jgi:hypothetical protein